MAPSKVQTNLLLVDDRPANLLTLDAVLTPLGQRHVHASSGEEALRQVLQADFAVILLDVEMRGMDGFETAALLKLRERTRHTPIIFLTASGQDPGLVFKGYEHGAVDYLLKPFHPDILRSKVGVFVELALAKEELKLKAALLRQKEREALEREGEERYRQLAEAMPQVVWASPPDGRIDYYNSHWSLYTGMSLAEALEKGWAPVMLPAEYEEARARWQSCVASGAPYEMEQRLRRASDGAYRWHLVRAFPIREDTGRISKWIGTCTDIHELKHSQHTQTFLADASAVLASSLDFEVTLESLARLAVPAFADCCTVDVLEAGLCRTVAAACADGADGSVAAVRGAFGPGLAHPEVLRSGKAYALFALTPALQEAHFTNPAQRARLLELAPSSYLCVPLLSRGKVFGALTLLLQAGSARRYDEEDLARAGDLARRAALAVDNAKLYREAQEAIRARDEFLSIASHELRTPLTPLHLKLQGLCREAQALAPEQFRDRAVLALSSAQSQVRKLTELVEALLDVSRISSGPLHLVRERVDLAKVAAEVLARLAPQAQRVGSALELDAPEPVESEWDAMRLDQLVANLLTNAIKYGPGKPIRVRVYQEGDRAVLSVADSGIGIAKEDLQRIFQRFERAVSERHYGGLGLGLYITQRIVDALGGAVRAESELGKGSTFTVELPIAAAPDGLRGTPPPGQRLGSR